MMPVQRLDLPQSGLSQSFACDLFYNVPTSVDMCIANFSSRSAALASHVESLIKTCRPSHSEAYPVLSDS